MNWSLNDDEMEFFEKAFYGLSQGADRVSVVVLVQLLKESLGFTKKSFEILWSLLDRDKDGRLTLGEFLIAVVIAKSNTADRQPLDSLPGSVGSLCTHSQPLSTIDATKLEEDTLLSPEGLACPLAKYGLRSFDDSFLPLTWASLKVIAYLFLNPYGLFKQIRSACDFESLISVLKSRSSYPLSRLPCSTILCCLSASIASDLVGISDWIACRCLQNNEVGYSRILLVTTLANCASNFQCLSRILETRLTRFSPLWLDLFIDQIQTETDPEWITDAIRFMLNWSIVDRQNHNKLIQSNFLLIIISRIDILTPLGSSYLLELAIDLSVDDPNIFKLIFEEFKLMDKMNREDLLKDERFLKTLLFALQFISKDSFNVRQGILLSENGVKILTTVFESNRSRQKTCLEIISSLLSEIAREDEVYGLTEFLVNICENDSIDAEIFFAAKNCLQKLHACGKFCDDHFMIKLLIRSRCDNDSLHALVQRLAEAESVDKDVVTNMITHLIDLSNLEAKLHLVSSVVQLLEKINFDIANELCRLIVNMLERLTLDSRFESCPVLSMCLSRLILRSRNILDVENAEQVLSILCREDTDFSETTLRAIVRIVREFGHFDCVVAHLKKFSLFPTRLVSKPIVQLIALWVFSDTFSRAEGWVVSLLFRALPGDKPTRNLVFACLARTIETGHVGPSQIDILLHAMIMFEIDHSILETCFQIMFFLLNSERNRRVLQAAVGFSETLVYLLRSALAQEALPTIAILLLVSLDEFILNQILRTSPDIVSRITREFNDERIGEIISRRNFMTFQATEVRAFAYFRIFSKIVKFARQARIESGIVLETAKSVANHLLVDLSVRATGLKFLEEKSLHAIILLDVLFFLQTGFDLIEDSSLDIEQIETVLKHHFQSAQIRRELGKLVYYARMQA